MRTEEHAIHLANESAGIRTFDLDFAPDLRATRVTTMTAI